MKRVGPPDWMERLLKSLLPVRDRETVVGDLTQEFREEKLAELGPWRAIPWYLRQVASFVPARLRAALAQPVALSLLCAFTALCAGWLGAMDLRLHRGFAGQMVIAATILSQALLTLAALRFRRYATLRYVSMLGCLALLFLAGKVLVGLFRGADFEGYILIIALALVFQCLLTLGTLAQDDTPDRIA